MYAHSLPLPYCCDEERLGTIARISSTRPDVAAAEIMTNNLHRIVLGGSARRGSTKFWAPQSRYIVVEHCVAWPVIHSYESFA